jgi:hypothetical protein
VFKLSPRVNYFSWFNHTYTTMSNRELGGGSIVVSRPTKSVDKQRSRTVDWVRRLIGRIPLPR